jgi:hypothetical protein
MSRPEFAGMEWNLPIPNPCKIVIITGGELFHHRFASQVQAEFPGQVVAWVQVGSCHRSALPHRVIGSVLDTGVVSKLLSSIAVGRSALSSIVRGLIPPRALAIAAFRAAERKVFRGDNDNCGGGFIAPKMIENPNSDELSACLESFDPNLVLVFGVGPKDAVIRRRAGGVTLQWCAGWGRDGVDIVEFDSYSKGRSSILALTDKTGSEVILRESSFAFADDDTHESCFLRAAALGTELMCDAVRDITHNGEVRAFRVQLPFDHVDYDRGAAKIEIGHWADLRRKPIGNEIYRKLEF